MAIGIPTTPSLINNFINSDFDSVKIVADNIDTIVMIAGNLDALIAVEANVTALAAQVTADEIQTNADAAQTALDLIATNQDTIDTAADALATLNDAIQTALDRIATGADAVSTAADAVSTGTDAATATTQAGIATAERILTTADRIQTGLDAIATSADRAAALVSAIASDASAVLSSTSAQDSANSATASSSSATSSATSETNSDASATLAQAYATNPVDVLVPTTTDHSALHWAQKAQDYAESISAAVVNQGPWDASPGIFPTPTLLPVEQVDTYRISVGGTLTNVDPLQDDVICVVGDTLLWNSVLDNWYVIGGSGISTVNNQTPDPSGNIRVTSTMIEHGVGNLETTVNGKVDATRQIITTGPMQGGATLAGDVTITIADATTAQKGATQLSDSTISTSVVLAATANSVRVTKVQADAGVADAATAQAAAVNAQGTADAYTAADVLAKLITVDGTGSGLDADTVDGIEGANIYHTGNKPTPADVVTDDLNVPGGLSVGANEDVPTGEVWAFAGGDNRFLFGSSPTTGQYGGLTWNNTDKSIEIGTTAYVGINMTAKADGTVSFAEYAIGEKAPTAVNHLTRKDYVDGLLDSHRCLVNATGTGAPNEIVDAVLPVNVALSTRYVLTNPFGINVPVRVTLEIFANGVWADPGLVYSAGSFGTQANYVQGVGIVVQTGSVQVVGSSADTGGGHDLGVGLTTAPCRVQVWRV